MNILNNCFQLKAKKELWLEINVSTNSTLLLSFFPNFVPFLVQTHKQYTTKCYFNEICWLRYAAAYHLSAIQHPLILCFEAVNSKICAWNFPKVSTHQILAYFQSRIFWRKIFNFSITSRSCHFLQKRAWLFDRWQF